MNEVTPSMPAINANAHALVTAATKRAKARAGTGWDIIGSDLRRALTSDTLIGMMATVEIEPISAEAKERTLRTWHRAMEIVLAD